MIGCEKVVQGSTNTETTTITLESSGEEFYPADCFTCDECQESFWMCHSEIPNYCPYCGREVVPISTQEQLDKKIEKFIEIYTDKRYRSDVHDSLFFLFEVQRNIDGVEG